MKEKDLDYIAALEKAIKKKYGVEAIENPAKFWNEEKEKDYIIQLKQSVEKQRKYEIEIEPENVNGVLITKKLLNKERKNNCSVCSKSVKNINDDIYLLKYDCCEKCYIKYVDGREVRWTKGWRPENVRKST
tara:strand:- start:1683 stop:2078 length:396 start_codon:yes stop_codon:yes gene_type:complete